VRPGALHPCASRTLRTTDDEDVWRIRMVTSRFPACGGSLQGLSHDTLQPGHLEHHIFDSNTAGARPQSLKRPDTVIVAMKSSKAHPTSTSNGAAFMASSGMRSSQGTGMETLDPTRLMHYNEPLRNMPLTAGSRLGSYEILGALGAGGMGEVYRARDLRLGREVAIKVLPADRLADENRRQRFVQEAQAASALNHPHIVTIHEIESEGDVDFIVMEYVRGRSLDALIPRNGMRLGELLRVAIPVAEALAAAHARGIVHRDLKPANVMVGTDGAVKVLDFGLAKLVGPETGPDGSTVTFAADAGLSSPGTVAGTAAYMAPEQATGAPVDARSDIFSFGAMLYEMATGARAFAGASTADTLATVIRAQPKPPTAIVPSLPRELERLILRCLRKEPDRRYQTIRDVSLELQEIKEESDSGTLAPAAPAPLARRRRGRLVAIGGAVVLVAAVAGFWVLRRMPGTSAPPMSLASLTTLPGLESHPTFSPDGDQVAFAWNGEKQDNWDIYLKLVGSSEVRRLTTDADRDDVPTWSPDSREIAFLRGIEGGQSVFTVSPVTGTERKLTSAASEHLVGLTWSHDGRWLATSRTDERQAGGLYLLPSEGGGFRTFMRATPPEYFGALAFSRDGRQLAYGACTATVRCHVKVVDVGADLGPTGPPRTLTRQPGLEPSGITWSRDGQSIVYSSDSRLWRVPADGSGAPERLDLAGIGAEEPVVAPDRDRLAFAQERTVLSAHPLDTTFTSLPVLASSAWDWDAQFSPDGHRLAFASTRAGEGAQIWTARADGSDARQLVKGSGTYQGGPAWSPDGRQIAFDFRHDDGSWSIFVVDADGGAPRQLTSDRGDENLPMWSRDGRWVYYTSDQKAGRNVWRIPAGGGRPQQITTSGSRYRSALSPDGTDVYFQPQTGGPATLLAAPAPLLAVPAAGGSISRQVLPCAADFATNAHGVYYVECGGNTVHQIHFIEAATARDRVIGRTEFLNTELTSTLVVSPDGKTVLVPRQTHTADLMLIENFR
jgi:eukaryotic-like serine/threonine-protein kinase